MGRRPCQAPRRASFPSYTSLIPGCGTYDTEIDTLVDSLEPGATAEFRTAQGLDAPGAVATYKVYVRLKSGGEAGSNSVTLTRPA